jgi:hypothetical protein
MPPDASQITIVALSKPIMESRRADSNRLPLLQLRVITQALLGVAEGCKCRILRGVSFLRLAACCTVLRSRWYQSGVNERQSFFTSLLACGIHLKFVQYPARHASIQLTLDRYPHWMPSLGRNTADGMDEALG